MKTLTNNVRQNNSFLVHLFSFEINNLDGTTSETLYFTDSDIFVQYQDIVYTPISLSFNDLTEDISMQSSSVSLTMDNINELLTQTAFSKEWRNNIATITRVIYENKQDIIDGDTYEYGFGDNLVSYPLANLDFLNKDAYVLFEGIIDSFSATEQTLNANISTKFTNWKKPFPSRTYNQNEFNTIINAITDTVYWGRVKDE